MLRVAVLGVGRMGSVHAANVAASPAAELAWVYDNHAETAATVAGRLATRAAGRIEDVLRDDAVQAVIIATPTPTHVELIMAAARAGKAVLCEKPIDLDLGRVDRCRRDLGAATERVMIAFQRRFDPALGKLRQGVRSGAIGRLHQVLITSRDPDVPPVAYLRTSGGLFRDMTIHDFDFARFLLPEEPARVTAVASTLLDPEVKAVGDHDMAMLVLETPSGVQCLINNSRRASYGCDQRVEVLGDSGMLRVENVTENTLELWDRSATSARSTLPHASIDRYAAAYLAELDAFLAAVEQQAPMPVGFEDGRRALVLAEAAYRALHAGATVDVPS